MIKVAVERLVDPRQVQGIAWGATPEGEAVLIVTAGGNRVLVAMAAEDAIQVGVGGCHVGEGLRQAQAEARGALPPNSLLTDSRGIPLGGG